VSAAAPSAVASGNATLLAAGSANQEATSLIPLTLSNFILVNV